MDLKEKTIEKNYVYDGKIIKVRNDSVLLPNGRTANREIVEHSGGCGIVALEDGYIYLVKQFRYAYNETLLEIPAGKLENEEFPELCAMRELAEETGLVASEVKFLSSIYPSCGYTNEVINIFLAESFEKSKSKLDEDEFLDVIRIKFQEALEMVLRGKIKDAKTIVGIMSVALLNKN